MTNQTQTTDDVFAQLSNLDAEQAFIGGVMMNPQYGMTSSLDPSDFYLKRLGTIWKSINQLFQQNHKVDILTVKSQLEKMGELDNVGGISFLTELCNRVPSSLHLAEYEYLIKEQAARRKALQIANDIAQGCLSDNFDETLEKAFSRLTQVSTLSYESVPIGEVASRVYDEVSERAKNPQEIWGMETGFVDLDKIIGGIHFGELIYIAGSTGAGKSILANQIGYHLSKYVGVGLFSLEMKDKKVLYRLLSGLSGVDHRNLKTGILSADQWESFTEAVGAVSKQPLTVWDIPLSTTQLRSEITRLKYTYGSRVFVVDYLYLMQCYKNLPQWERTEMISTDLKQIVASLDVTIIGINSITKESTKGTPKLGGMRGSGSLENDADVVMWISRSPTLNDSKLREIQFTKIRDSHFNPEDCLVIRYAGTDIPHFETVDLDTVNLNGSFWQNDI